MPSAAEPVSKAAIREVIGLAMRAPSSLNTQPWNFDVVAGEVLDRIRAGNTERNPAGVPHSREFRIHGEYAGPHRERQIEIARQLFAAMGWPDETFPANAVVSNRKSVDEAVRFVGFGED